MVKWNAAVTMTAKGIILKDSMKRHDTGLRTQNNRSEEIENFCLLKEFRLNPLTNEFMMIGIIGRRLSPALKIS